MDSDEGKLFVGGISWDTTEDTLREHFGKYGQVTQTVIMMDKITQRPRGFGFVVFADPSVLDAVLQETHSIDGRNVEAKRALSREEQQNSRTGNSIGGRSFGGSGTNKTKKIFVGGLPSTLKDDEFRRYFETYGDVTDVVIMFDQNTNKPRGFGFISFDTEDAVDRVLHKTFHELHNKLVEVKRALPKDAHQSGGGRGSGRGHGGGYQGYASAGANASGFDGRTDGNRYIQQQSTGGGFPPFTNYGAPNYGYGAANSNMGYGGYGAGGGYGSANAGYGNPNGPNTGYASGAAGALKSTWGNQAPGYGTSGGFGATAGYGTNVHWNSQGGVSAGGASGYGNQGYGYGSYGGSDGGYGNVGGRSGNVPNSNASSGGEQQGAGGGYGAYGSNGSSGY